MYVCVLVYATLWGPNVPTKIVKPDIFYIVGTGREKIRKKIMFISKCNNANRFSVRGRFRIRVVLEHIIW